MEIFTGIILCLLGAALGLIVALSLVIRRLKRKLRVFEDIQAARVKRVAKAALRGGQSKGTTAMFIPGRKTGHSPY